VPLARTKLIVFFLVTTTSFLFAESRESLLLAQDFGSEYVGNYCWLYEDTSAVQTIENIFQVAETNWEKQQQPKIIKGISSSNFWMKFELNNTSQSTQEMALVLENAVFDRVQFFITDGMHLIDRSQLMGDLLPFKERAVPHRYFVYPFQIPANTNWQMYTMAGKMGGKFVCPLVLYTANEWTTASSRLDLYYGLSTGFHVMLFIFCLLLLIVIRKRYVFYFMMQLIAVYLFFLATTGLGFQYLWPNAVYFQQSISVIPNILLLLFKVLFVLSFFEHLQAIPTALRILKVIIYLQIISLILPIVGFIFGGPLLALGEVIPSFQRIYIMLSGLTAHLFNLIGTILITYVLIRYYRRVPNKPYRIYSIISIIEMASILFAYILYFTTINLTFFSIPDFIIYINTIEGIVIISFMMMEYKSTISANEQLAFNLSKKQNEALQNLLAGQEKERKRLSREIHDGLSIRLGQIQSSLKKLQGKDASVSDQEISPIVTNLDHLHQDLRNFSHNLNPVILNQFGIKKAVNRLIFNIEMNHPDLDIHFNCLDAFTLDKDREKHCYHIIQELLNNTLKYANASTITIDLAADDTGLELFYADNGKGLTNRQNESPGIGLQNIQSRVDLMEGSYSRENQSTKGLAHQIMIPSHDRKHT